MILDSCVRGFAYEPLLLGCGDSQSEHSSENFVESLVCVHPLKTTPLEGMFGLFHVSQDGMIKHIKESPCDIQERLSRAINYEDS